MSNPTGGFPTPPRAGRWHDTFGLRAAVGGAVAALGVCGTAAGQSPKSPALSAPPSALPPLVLPAPATPKPAAPAGGVVQAQVPMPLGPSAPVQPLGPAVPQPQPLPVAPQPAAPAAQPGAGQLGQPRQLPFGEDQRLPRLGVLGSTPRPTPQELEEARQYVEGVIDPKFTLDLIAGRSRLILLKATPKLTQVADETVVRFSFLPDRPRQLTIQGLRPGTTVVNLIFADPADANREKVISYLVRVLPDPELLARLEAQYKALEQEINAAYPRSRVKLKLVGDKLMVTGQAHDVQEAAQILQILRANAPGGAQGVGAGQAPVLNVANTAGNPLDPLNPAGSPGLGNYQATGGPNVINNLRVTGEQQVQLRVVVAEVNRAAARSIGLNYSYTNAQGRQVFAQNTGSSLNLNNLPFAIDNGRVPVALDALRTLNYARSLAEPTLTTLNGQPAFALVGGSFPVPVLGGIGQVGNGLGGLGGGSGFGGGLQGVQFVPFGVQLSFTPIINDRDRIRLTVQATVSTRDNNAGANIGGANVPGLNARTFSTTVELRDGQTLAVAGLIQNNLGSDSSRVPLLGDIPVLGRAFRVDRISAGEQELVVLVTPELVHPLEANELSHLPGSDLFEPGDLEFYLLGRMESRRSYDYRSPVMNDIHRMLKYRKCEQQYLIGPTGHAEQLLTNSPAAR